tara:strand:- start:114 stop:485 length:372 start_codon:yes stop_codon:yes gene_type:complete
LGKNALGIKKQIMTFKMKGPSLYKKLKVNRNGYSGTLDGRPTSSPFQATIKQDKSKTIEKIDEESNRVYVSDTNKVGDWVSEDELESKFTKKGSDPKNYPQLSVQDYSKVKVDKDGRKYVEKK